MASRVPLAPRWRLLLSPAADGAHNMAVDHALLDRAATQDEAVLRLYAWRAPTVSLGLHEKARFEAAAAEAQGLDVVRRPTGGRALLHHREVTYSVTAPARETALREAYTAINRLLLAALHRLGVAAAEAPRRGRPLAPDGAACFAEPNVGEIVVDGRKLVGSAQRRDEHAFLQHGSILLHDDQPRVTALRGAAPPPPAATLAAALGREVTPTEVMGAIVAALETEIGGAIEPLHEQELGAAIGAHLATYRDPRWTYRR